MRRLALILPLMPLPALAQQAEPTLGVAFVQAVEQFSGVVFATDYAEAASLAMADCTGAGAQAQDCQVMAWCQPAGWAVQVAMMHTEGPHWSEFHCGLPDAATATAVADALCDSTARPYLIECNLVQMWDWDGAPQASDDLDAPTKN